jgi:hypothetical protein
LGVPALCYRVRVDERYDDGFYRLPNLLSHPCFDFAELRDSLEKVLAGRLGGAGGAERRELMNHYLAALDGPMACQRIVEVLEEVAVEFSERARPGLGVRLRGQFAAEWRRLDKKIRSLLPETVNHPEFQKHRYPELLLEEVQSRASLFRKLLGGGAEIRVGQLSSEIFEIRS